MTPKTKRQIEVAKLSAKLPKLNEKQISWLKKKTLPHVAYLCKNEVWCSDCAHVFAYDGKEKTICEKCGQKLTVEKSRKKFVNHKTMYATLYTTRKNYQIARYFLIDNATRKGVSTWTNIYEVVQIWINKNDAKKTIVARALKCMPRFIDDWNLYSPMEVRLDRVSYYGSRYHIWSKFTLPNARFLPILKRNGLTMGIDDIVNPIKLIPALLSPTNDYEWLLKTKQYAILKYLVDRDTYQTPYKHAINVCNRNHYIIEDASMYFDYLQLLTFFEKDTHNAHYVCPEDLKKEHDKLVRKKRIIDEKREEEERIRIALENEKLYQEMKSKYFGICLRNKKFIITVLKSVDEFIQEGKAMHHCVFTNKYFLRENSLILSAKDHDGNRLETIEVDLKTFMIIQSRGKFNSNSEFHDDIVKLVRRKMNVIRKIA